MRLVNAGRTLVMAAVLFAGPFVAAPAASADSGAPGQPEARFRTTLVARHSDKCLDVSGVSTQTGANIHQWTCIFGQPNQEWRLA